MASGQLRVKAGPNGPVILEGEKRRKLDESGQDTNVIRDEAVLVPNTRYYRRRIEKGDLVLIEQGSLETTGEEG